MEFSFQQNDFVVANIQIDLRFVSVISTYQLENGNRSAFLWWCFFSVLRSKITFNKSLRTGTAFYRNVSIVCLSFNTGDQAPKSTDRLSRTQIQLLAAGSSILMSPNFWRKKEDSKITSISGRTTFGCLFSLWWNWCHFSLKFVYRLSSVIFFIRMCVDRTQFTSLIFLFFDSKNSTFFLAMDHITE